MHEIPLGDNSMRSCLISLNSTINLKDAQRQDKDLMVAIDYIEQSLILMNGNLIRHYVTFGTTTIACSCEMNYLFDQGTCALRILTTH